MRLIVNNLKLPIEHDLKDVYTACAKVLRCKPEAIKDLIIKHKSIDARDKNNIKVIFSVSIEIANADRYIGSPKYKNVLKDDKPKYELPKGSYKGKPIIVGAGPAGLFCAYILVLAGLEPIIIERGSKAEVRKKDVEDFWNTGILKPNSNVSFGEGGAGTFSDGKLNTLVKDKNGRCSFVLETFVKFGAPENILYDAKPHVGTDILINVVRNMREFIIEHGGSFLFDSQVVDLLIQNSKLHGVAVDTPDGNIEILSDRVILAIGHSARDTFSMLINAGLNLRPKAFAVGFRIEHPRRYIDKAQYGVCDNPHLPAATYKLTAQTSLGRGVYSFCMCPGGYVVNASTETNALAVNGMSYSGRNGNNSNSALIVTVTPEDFPDDSSLAGVKFQRELEAKAYELGKGNIPIQQIGDFYQGVGYKEIQLSESSVAKYGDAGEFLPQIKGSFCESDLHKLMPDYLNKSMIEALAYFGNKIKGFDASDAYLSGIESRTSSPVKMERDDAGQSVDLEGLYPCGEGAGYAGGITSAAMDGIYIAERILVSNE